MNKKTLIGVIIAIVIIIAAIVGYGMLGDNNETSNTTQNVARTTSANSNTTEENTGANQNVLIAYIFKIYINNSYQVRNISNC